VKGNITMSTAAVAPVAPVSAPIVVSDPVFVNTESGAVAVYGHEFVSKKDLVILAHCLTLPEFSKGMGAGFSPHNVKSVVFRTDNRPKDDKGGPVLANAAFDAGAITVNLLQTVTSGIEDAMKNNQVSIFASYHRNMIMNFLHEIHHLSTLDEVPKDEELKEMAEEDAQLWAMDCLIYLAKTVDIEPAHHAESSFLAGQLMELLAENTDPWAIAQRNMLDNHIMYLLAATDEKKEMAFYNFKGYAQILSGDVTSPDWNKETILGAGALNPFEAAIRAISEVIPAMHTPTSAMINSSAAYNDMQTESEIAMEEDQGGWHSAEMGMDMEPTNTMFPVGVVPVSHMSAPPQPNPTATFNGFPVGQPTAPQHHTQPVASSAGLTNEQIAVIVKGVYDKCYQHIFQHCGRLLNSDTGFSIPKAVYRLEVPLNPEDKTSNATKFIPFGIPLTPVEQAVVVGMNCMDVNEHFCSKMLTSGGILFGNTMKNTNLPHYKLYINMGGQIIQRLLLPQNPATRDRAGQYKQTAMAARTGSAIMYVFEGDDAIVAAGGKKLTWKNTNGQWEKC
jgi:hypothetical protein